MGMSASQARLLSITARLTNNEFRSQTSTNAKLRLAEKTKEATVEYNTALDSQKLVYMNYDDEGAATTTNLTPTLLYAYEPLKNQYAMIDNSGRMLVSALDAHNYETTDSLFDFLSKYNLVYDMTESVKKLREDEYQELYNTKKDYYDNYLYKPWKIQHDQWTINHTQWETNHAQWEIAHAQWVSNPYTYDYTLYQKFSNAVGKSDDFADGHVETGSRGCYSHALNPVDQNSASCYAHVLGHLIDFNGSTCGNNGNGGNYTTSAGDTIQILGTPGGYMAGQCDDIMQECSNAINEVNELGEYKRLCDGTDDYKGTSGVTNRLEKAKEDYAAGRISETRFKVEKLVSDYIDDEQGGYKLKPLKQKAIDLMYLSKHWEPAGYNNDIPENELSRNEMVDILINFTDGDMKMVTLNPEPIEPIEPKEPIEPIFTPPAKPNYDDEKFAVIRDQDKSQWYINLWFAMNGSNTANLAKDINFDSIDSIWSAVPEDIRAEYRYTVADSKKDEHTKNYKVMEDNLATSSEWLQFALEQGIITLSQASYINPAEDGKRVLSLKSEGVIWKTLDAPSNAKDLIYVEDEEKIAMAEVKYKKTMSEIRNDDNKYDQELKKLDTEHNALQTEYESIKNVIQKNTERSFKLFS